MQTIVAGEANGNAGDGRDGAIFAQFAPPVSAPTDLRKAITAAYRLPETE